MKPRILILGLLWVSTVAAAWWFGHREGTQSATASLIAIREAVNGPTKPNPPGKNSAATPTGAADSSGTPLAADGGPVTLSSILAQVKVLMRQGGMQNPSAAIKTLTLLGQIRDEDIQEALKAAADFKEPQAKMMLHMVLLSRWAETDGPAALKYAEDNLSDAGPMVQAAKMGVLSSWAQKDPDAAWEYLQSNDDVSGGMFGGRNMMMMGLFSALATRDPDQAFARLASLDDPQERQMALNGIAQTAYDDTARARLMEEISNLPDANERREARSAVLGQLAMMDPEQAITMTNALPVDDRKDVAQRVGSMLLMADPERGATFMLENAEPEKRKDVYQNIITQWANNDPNKAGAWLGSQPQTPELDSARSSFATTVAPRDPESAMAWAQTVTEENQRAFAIDQVYKSWKAKDEAAAVASLEASGLPPERIATIRSGKPPEAPIPTAPSPQ